VSLFLYDTMTGSDSTALTSHTPEVGGSYSIHPSATLAPIITSNRARANTDVGWVYNNAVPPTADYVVEGFWRQVTDEVANAGLQARLSTSADTYYIARYSQDANEVQLRKVVATAATSLGTSSLSLSNGDDLHIRFVCTDDRKEVWINGSRLITSTDNEITAKGVAGMRFTALSTGATTGLHLDYVRAYSVGQAVVSNKLRPGIFMPGLAR